MKHINIPTLSIFAIIVVIIVTVIFPYKRLEELIMPITNNHTVQVRGVSDTILPESSDPAESKVSAQEKEEESNIEPTTTPKPDILSSGVSTAGASVIKTSVTVIEP